MKDSAVDYLPSAPRFFLVFFFPTSSKASVEEEEGEVVEPHVGVIMVTSVCCMIVEKVCSTSAVDLLEKFCTCILFMMKMGLERAEGW